jgi:hypothetical protein
MMALLFLTQYQALMLLGATSSGVHIKCEATQTANRIEALPRCLFDSAR